MTKNKLVSDVLRILLVISCFALCGCTSLSGCIDADDFGTQARITVNSSYAPGATQFIDMQGVTGEEPKERQTITWQDTGLVTDGNTLVIRISGGWCPVAACAPSGADIDDQYATPVANIYPFANFNRVPVKNFVGITKQCPFCSFAPPPAGFGGYGKWFTEGVGLYILLQRPGDSLPNASLKLISNPISPVLHLGAFAPDGQYISHDKLPMDQMFAEHNLQDGWRIFLKILDTHYYDNNGMYNVTFVSGFRIPGQIMPFEWVRKGVEKILLATTRQQFQGIIDNIGYQQLVRLCLSLFISFTFLSYLMGMAQISLGDLFIRIFKASIVAVMLSPTAWVFFNNSLFSIFTSGTRTVIAMVTGQNNISDSTFEFLDKALWHQMYSKVVWEAKIQAILSAGNLSGFLWILAFCFVLLYFTWIAIYVVCIYLTCMVGIYFLIAMFPICILGLLFSIFRGTFDAFLSQSLSLMMQSIMVMVALVYFISFIFQEMYRTLGFRTCLASVFEVTFGSTNSNNETESMTLYSLKMFVPGPKKYYVPISLLYLGNGSSNKQRYKFDKTLRTIWVPPEYDVKDFRYVEVPFLDPNPGSSAVEDPKSWENDSAILAYRDYIRLKEIMDENSLVQYRNIFVMVVMTILMGKVVDMADSMGQYFAIGGMTLVPTASSALAGLGHDVAKIMSKFKAGQIVLASTVGKIEKFQNRIGILGDKALDTLDGAAARGLMAIPDKLAGKEIKGGNFLARHAFGTFGVDAKAKELEKFTIIHAYRDAVGAPIDYINDRTKFAVPLAKMAFTGAGLPTIFSAGEGAAAGQDIKDLAKSSFGDFKNLMTSEQKLKDSSIKEHFHRIMSVYRPQDFGHGPEDVSSHEAQDPQAASHGKGGEINADQTHATRSVPDGSIGEHPYADAAAENHPERPMLKIDESFMGKHSATPDELFNPSTTQRGGLDSKISDVASHTGAPQATAHHPTIGRESGAELQADNFAPSSNAPHQPTPAPNDVANIRPGVPGDASQNNFAPETNQQVPYATPGAPPPQQNYSGPLQGTQQPAFGPQPQNEASFAPGTPAPQNYPGPLQGTQQPTFGPHNPQGSSSAGPLHHDAGPNAHGPTTGTPADKPATKLTGPDTQFVARSSAVSSPTTVWPDGKPPRTDDVSWGKDE